MFSLICRLFLLLRSVWEMFWVWKDFFSVGANSGAEKKQKKSTALEKKHSTVWPRRYCRVSTWHSIKKLSYFFFHRVHIYKFICNWFVSATAKNAENTAGTFIDSPASLPRFPSGFPFNQREIQGKQSCTASRSIRIIETNARLKPRVSA